MTSLSSILIKLVVRPSEGFRELIASDQPLGEAVTFLLIYGGVGSSIALLVGEDSGMYALSGEIWIFVILLSTVVLGFVSALIIGFFLWLGTKITGERVSYGLCFSMAAFTNAPHLISTVAQGSHSAQAAWVSTVSSGAVIVAILWAAGLEIIAIREASKVRPWQAFKAWAGTILLPVAVIGGLIQPLGYEPFEDLTKDHAWVERSREVNSLELTDYGGESWSRSDLENKVTFVNVWASWCVPCIHELPNIQQLHEQFIDDPSVSVITINVDEDEDRLEKHMSEADYTFPTLLAEDSAPDPFSGSSIPRSYIVDRHAVVQWERLGAISAHQWDTVRELIAEVREAEHGS